MDPTTTTDDPIMPIEDGAEPAQPTSEDQSTAANEPQPTTTPTDAPDAEPPAESTDSQDDNLEWLQKKGIDPTSPEAISKVAEMYRNAEKAMHESTSKASELEKTLSGGLQEQIDQAKTDGNLDVVQELAAEIQNLKLQQNVNSFFNSQPEAKELEAKMTEIVNERPEIGNLVKSGYLSLGDLYNLAKASDPSREQQLKADGGREALQKVADKQQGRSVPGVATTSATADDNTSDPFLKAFSED